jgi:hypothetical protein
MGSFFAKLFELIKRYLPGIEADVTSHSVSVKFIPSRADLELMSKKELDVFAETQYSIHLDGRKTKSAMIDQFFAELDAQE